MKVFGIGIDVVEVARIAAAIERHGEPFLARIFTTAERAYCESRKHPAMHYAARFAAKEAVVKALARVDGNMLKAAELLGISRPTLYDLMSRHAIKQ